MRRLELGPPKRVVGAFLDGVHTLGPLVIAPFERGAEDNLQVLYSAA
jgi:hypothetical protein